MQSGFGQDTQDGRITTWVTVEKTTGGQGPFYTNKNFSTNSFMCDLVGAIILYSINYLQMFHWAGPMVPLLTLLPGKWIM